MPFVTSKAIICHLTSVIRNPKTKRLNIEHHLCSTISQYTIQYQPWFNWISNTEIPDIRLRRESCENRKKLCHWYKV